MAYGDKAWAQNSLRHQKNTLMLILASIHMLKMDECRSLDGSSVMLNDHLTFNPTDDDRKGKRIEISFRQVLEIRSNNPDAFEADIQNLYLSTRRNAVKEAFETTLAFAKFANCVSDFEAQPWYAFSYHLRNAYSHDMRFSFTTAKSKRLAPTIWEGATIDILLDGKEITTDILSPHRTMELLLQMNDFIENK